MIVSNKLKNNETIIYKNCAVVNVEWKYYPAAIVYLRGDQIGLFKLVTLNCILNRITGVTFGC
jgi:hypothetical protein